MVRFAVIAGVSTDAQAREEKQSIPDQVENCRRYIAANGGVESVPPYIMDGYSRTGYDSLELAMQAIPPLAQAIRDAQADRYDVLIMDHFDRLGDLGLLALVRFKRIRKQLFSVRQSGKLYNPETYNPYDDESADMQMRMHGIIQSYRINKIRRAWETGVPDRASAGLHPLTIPYGYKLGPRSAPAEIIPDQARLLREMKDMYLSGKTLQAIVDHANASGVPPRRSRTWQIAVVRRIIHNPYYAGFTVFGKFRKLDGQRIAQPPSKWIRGNGQHTPLWDEQTHYAILAESARREGLRSRSKTHALTGLCECAKCGQRLHHHGTPPYTYLSCHDKPAHIKLRYDHACEIIFAEIVTQIQSGALDAPGKDSAGSAQSEINKQHALRKKVQEGYELDLYTAQEAQKKIAAIELRIEQLQRKQADAARLVAHKTAAAQFASLPPDRMLYWLTHDDPSAVNHILTTLCQKIIVTPKTHKIHIIWRD
jgi:site-specific DNA recombinase